jgi:hypothetical protein
MPESAYKKGKDKDSIRRAVSDRVFHLPDGSGNRIGYWSIEEVVMLPRTWHAQETISNTGGARLYHDAEDLGRLGLDRKTAKGGTDLSPGIGDGARTRWISRIIIKEMLRSVGSFGKRRLDAIFILPDLRQ